MLVIRRGLCTGGVMWVMKAQRDKMGGQGMGLLLACLLGNRAELFAGKLEKM